MSEFNEQQLALFSTLLNESLMNTRADICNIFRNSDHASHHIAAKNLDRLSTDELIEFASKIEHSNLQKDIDKIKKIDASLISMQMGMYGLCSDCETPLSLERLLQNPTTQRCPSCDEKYKKQKYNNYRL